MLSSLDNPRTRDQVILRLHRLTPSTPARWGIMSSIQMLQHLSMALRIPLGELAVADVPNRKLDSHFYRFMALTAPIPWPKGITTPPELDFTITPPLQAEFDRERTDFIALIQRLSQTPPASLHPIHPMMGAFSYAQWMRWGYRHTSYHLRQFGC